MAVDVVDLREFYATPLGRAVTGSLKESLDRLEALPVEGITLGYGYPLPVFAQQTTESSQTAILMPARQGALKWPVNGPSQTALVEDGEIPVTNASVDCVVLLHALETAGDPSALLEEVWRVLAPEGRLIIVATNRRGFWSRFEHTPFGNGQPFSSRQLRNLLRKAKLTPLKWDESLNFPPIRSKWLMRIQKPLDRLGRRLWPLFCGVHVIVATKRLYQAIPASAKKARGAASPVFVPQAASRNGGGNRKSF